jgi:hypothetical protein
MLALKARPGLCWMVAFMAASIKAPLCPRWKKCVCGFYTSTYIYPTEDFDQYLSIIIIVISTRSRHLVNMMSDGRAAIGCIGWLYKLEWGKQSYWSGSQRSFSQSVSACGQAVTDSYGLSCRS